MKTTTALRSRRRCIPVAAAITAMTIVSISAPAQAVDEPTETPTTSTATTTPDTTTPVPTTSDPIPTLPDPPTTTDTGRHHDRCAGDHRAGHDGARTCAAQRAGAPGADRQHPGDDSLRRISGQLQRPTQQGQRVGCVPVHRLDLERLRRLPGRLPRATGDPGRTCGTRRQPLPGPVEQRRLDDSGHVVLPTSIA